MTPMPHPPFDAVVKVLNTYFDGLYHSDTGRLAQVFHPRAIYASMSDGALLFRTMAEYFPVVDARPAPAARGERRRDNILAIDFAGPATATARVTCAMGAKRFTDCLTLILDEGRWQIIAKVFHHEPLTE